MQGEIDREDAMHFLIVSVGTAGNVLPFIGLGVRLKARGHQVTLAASAEYRRVAEREGFEFVDLDPPADERRHDPNNRPKETGKLLEQLRVEAVDLARRVYQVVAERSSDPKLVVVSQGWLFGARMAREKLNVPLATVHLQPMLLRTAYEKPGWIPSFVPRAVHRVVDVAIDRSMGRGVNQFRREIGLPPVRRLMHKWWYSPDLVVGFFPEWFSPRQPDHPANLVLPGFPLYDSLDPPDPIVLERVDAFLSAGASPILFTQPTLPGQARTFFEQSIEIAQGLGRRAILLSGKEEELPSDLPAEIAWFKFLPLSKILSRCAAVVHHGGMGSIGQALAAGIPQLATPRFLDQPNNSQRLQQLGVSDTLDAKRFSPHEVHLRLERLLTSPEVAERCRHWAGVMAKEDAFGRLSEALEQTFAR